MNTPSGECRGDSFSGRNPRAAGEAVAIQVDPPTSRPYSASSGRDCPQKDMDSMRVTKTVRCFCFVSCALILFAIFGLMFFGPPLVRSSAYATRYSVDNAVHEDAVLYKPLLTSGIYYLYLPAFDKEPHYAWFGIDFPRHTAFVPTALYRCSLGFTYIHRDQANGVSLLSKKAGNWTVTFSDNEVFYAGEGLVAICKPTAEDSRFGAYGGEMIFAASNGPDIYGGSRRC